MEYDEVVVKESPGLCRCCLSEGCYKDLGTEYTWMSETEVYAEMLLECFDIGITQHNDGPNGPNRLICEVCITRLRDACNFKKQVLESEKKFIDMIGRGEFRPKVLIYQTQMKSEDITEEEDQVEETEVEYLEDDIDFVDADDEPLKSLANATISEVTDTRTPLRNKRGRPRKNPSSVKTEKKVKVDKEEKPKTSKAMTKGRNTRALTKKRPVDRLRSIRKNVAIVLRYGNLIPFKWCAKGFKCFYCDKLMKNCDILKRHTLHHNSIDLDKFTQKLITANFPIKVNVANISCKACPESDVKDLEGLMDHVVKIHGEEYDSTVGVWILPFLLNLEDATQCVLCNTNYDNFSCLITHMFKQHVDHSYICQVCGVKLMDRHRLNAHIKNIHVGYKCTICGKILSALCKLEKHKERYHGQIRIIECNLCYETFGSKYLLKVHMGKEHNVAKYRIKCEHCPKISTTKGAMMLHIQSMHSNVKYKCELCDYVSAIKWVLKLHTRKHFGVKVYSCSICERRFGRSGNLRSHMQTHSGHPGRVCRFCHLGFTGVESLNTHIDELHYYENC